jgi:hypothetical protein
MGQACVFFQAHTLLPVHAEFVCMQSPKFFSPPCPYYAYTYTVHTVRTFYGRHIFRKGLTNLRKEHVRVAQTIFLEGEGVLCKNFVFICINREFFFVKRIS